MIKTNLIELVSKSSDKTNEASESVDTDVNFPEESIRNTEVGSEGASLTSSVPAEMDLLPKQIVQELDRYIIGQHDAKRAIAIALRDRKRRMMLDIKLRNEVTPKNILMIGPSGVGKTEIARRAAKITACPFIKEEATKFTQIGYYGKNVDSIPKDLLDSSFKQLRGGR